MSKDLPVIKCSSNEEINHLIDDFINEIEAKAHLIGNHGLSESEFWNSGIFRGAIERLRGSQAASMKEKREFISYMLNVMMNNKTIKSWKSSGATDRHDYEVELHDGKIIAIEAKGSLDGNNTNIFKRPPNATEFYIWSVVQNPASDPRKNVWSGIHTRLSAEIIDKGVLVDGLIVWSMECGSKGRPCPKGNSLELRGTSMPAPCLYLFPGTISNPRNNKVAAKRCISDSHFFKAVKTCFKVKDKDIQYVEFKTKTEKDEWLRQTIIYRNDEIVKESNFTVIKRTK